MTTKWQQKYKKIPDDEVNIIACNRYSNWRQLVRWYVLMSLDCCSDTFTERYTVSTVSSLQHTQQQ